jgi:hypothetical protein
MPMAPSMPTIKPGRRRCIERELRALATLQGAHRLLGMA